MNVFRLRDLLSVLLWRLLGRPFFGRFGRGVRVVWPLRLVGMAHMHLANHVTLQVGAYVAVLPGTPDAPGLVVGRGTLVGNYAHIIVTHRVEIGEKVLIADRVYLSDNLHDYRDVTRPVMDQPLRQTGDVVIGDGSWIGENVCIIGARIGRHCTVGANSVVTRDLPDHCVAAGAPVVIVRRYCEDTRTWRPTDPEGHFLP
jgi:acetyltransferase-like isoleucine patch superfamily enzyme